MSDVVLIYTKTGMDVGSSIAPPHNLLCIAAPLVKAGYKVKIIDQRVNSNWALDLLNELATRPIYVGIPAMTGTQTKFSMECARMIRQDRHNVPIVWGGAHPTVLPEQVIESGLADYVCVREVDETIVQITRDIANHKAKQIIDSPLPDMEKLLPEPYELLDIEKYIHPDIYMKGSHRAMDLGQTSRGCPYQCVVSGTPINTLNHSCKKIEGIYDKNEVIVGYKDNEVVSSQIVYGKESVAEEVIEITVEDGRVLVVTPNHPIFTKRGWINAGDLLDTDEVLTIASPDMKNRGFKQCNYCGSYKLMNKNSKYCSKECHDKSQIKERESKICPICNKPFNTNNTRMLNQIYCSQSCSTKASNSNRDMTYLAENLKNPEILKKIRDSKIGDKNPMKRQEVVTKMKTTSIEHNRYDESSTRMKRLHEEGKIPHGDMTIEVRKAHSERMKVNNPMFNPSIVKMAMDTKMSNYSSGITSKPVRTIEQRKHYSESKIGEKNPLWRGGSADEPYVNFGRHIKKVIRERDGYQCQLCGKSEFEELLDIDKNLVCHHVDYNRKNSTESNLILLCNYCNIKVNFNREYWQEYFTNKMNGNKERICVLSGKE